ncbi:hypothetical protein [Pseudomonas amygdali]|uniref:Leucine rich repeat domain protein n=2 Tax=Pseudomonas amygdali pv. lachrymans TaxID=53707 RepID=A0ABR5KQB7_PSEAV|nr:hypothetical protein [Pseudomonas amygdali]AXH59576.1 hypothetical protein PLA107_030590 [Pseudomonas amygdali pv. lachrymans str. M301315]KPC17002.1 Uncharacterized protein AC499_0204 [Pseudomonas amygdali pv. lachrymans]KPC17961.1 Uncharacterized protein AC499_1163 [Pseudomonas amygdali pv. lachrymans]RMT06323.1 hypothetical protein ALP54_03497 [Pseudomonas amygdali pv. lachrymans]
MFSISVPDDPYRRYSSPSIEPLALLEAAPAAYQWLLGFAGEPDTPEAALESLRNEDIGNEKAEEHLNFALSLALCSPCPGTGQLFQAYEVWLGNNSKAIARLVLKMAKHLAPVHQVDTLTAFGSLLARQHFQPAFSIYSTDRFDLIFAAIARDDLAVVLNALPEDFTAARREMFNALAIFPADPSSRIHQAFINSQAYEHEMTLYRLEALRSQLSFSTFSYGPLYLRLPSASLCALSPGVGLTLKVAPEDRAYAVHLTSAFKETIDHDPDFLVQRFFRHQGNMLSVNSVNWCYVDEVINAFLDAGITPEKLLEEVVNRNEKRPLGCLSSVLSTLVEITPDNQRFYQVAFRAFFAQQGIGKVVSSCLDDRTLLAVYHATGEPAYLQAGNHQVRDAAMASDLGL